jgi:hypothetical protein
VLPFAVMRCLDLSFEIFGQILLGFQFPKEIGFTIGFAIASVLIKVFLYFLL